MAVGVLLTPQPAPAVTAVSPQVGPLAGGTSVTVTGTNLTGATAVDFGATAGTTVVVAGGGASLTVNSPAEIAGTVDITVVTPSGTSPTNAPADQFTYTGAPTVTGVSPSGGPIAGGTTVTVTGVNFTGATAVHFGATAGTGLVVNSGTSVTAVSPAAGRSAWAMRCISSSRARRGSSRSATSG